MPPEDLATPPILLKIDGRYISADNLRFACILSIIAIHTVNVSLAGAPEGSAAVIVLLAAVTLVKFGTIGFFLISGFLLEKNLQTRGSLDLMQRRIRKVFLPWIFWFFVTCAALSAADFAHHKRAFLPGTPLPVAIWETAVHTFTATAFWFVPNLLLSLMVLLIFRRYLQSLIFGGVLLATSLFYSVNIYTHWIEAHHTRAIFGFIFYLWLGHYAAINVERFSGLLRSIPRKALWLATAATAIAQLGEGRLLMHLHSVDPLNTLKVTTQVFSVLVCLCFFKYQRRIWPAFMDVSRTPFGMYLTHVLILSIFTSLWWRFINGPEPHPFLNSVTGRTTIWLAMTTLTSGVSFALTRAVSASQSLGWIVGSSRRTAKPRASRDDVPKVAIA